MMTETGPSTADNRNHASAVPLENICNISDEVHANLKEVLQVDRQPMEPGRIVVARE